MFKWFKLLMQTAKKSAFERGMDYAREQLGSGKMTCEQLQKEASNDFDFNDFDRGILEVVNIINAGAVRELRSKTDA